MLTLCAIWSRCVGLQISDSNEFLERTFLSPAAVRAGLLISSWMRDAGLFTYVPTPLSSLTQKETRREGGRERDWGFFELEIVHFSVHVLA